MSEKTPAKTLDILLEISSARTQRTLQAIFLICEEQKKRGMNDYSAATISRLGKGRGVPAAQSIRNESGAKYQTLLSSFVTDSLDSKLPLTVSNKPATYSWIESLQDPVVKLQANILYSQKKEAERLVQEVVPIDQIIEVYDGDVGLAQSKKLTNLERIALEHIISEEFLRNNGLKLGVNASLVNLNDESVVFPVATVDAIKKALQFL